MWAVKLRLDCLNDDIIAANAAIYSAQLIVPITFDWISPHSFIQGESYHVDATFVPMSIVDGKNN